MTEGQFAALDAWLAAEREYIVALACGRATLDMIARKRTLAQEARETARAVLVK